ncbi:matrilin-2-like [Ruditapes philippinarum]|uniref:matrilin-2-like n=1 Tax=Ruditapes philippinarum TaxID=129788 RepID=UPI00295A8D11|nr:matrilin-2-like [Ruditapes philippinarum]
MLHRALSICFISVGICITTCQATVKVTETSCTKDASDQCVHTPNAECDNAVSGAKCKCSDGFIEDKTDGSTCVKKVTQTSCVKATADQCEHTPNAECDNAETDAKCKCSDGFIEDKTDGSTCVKKVTETSCAEDTADQCEHTPNAECDNAETDAKCKCSDGFIEDKTDGSTCVKKKVTETSCIKDAADQCKHTPNAECDNVANNAKCKCSDGFIEDKTDGSTCVKVLGGTCKEDRDCTEAGEAGCTDSKCSCKADFGEKDNKCVKTVSGTPCSENGKECENINNSHCDTDKCKCNSGYVMQVDECTAKNSAVSIQLGTLTVLLSGLATLIQQF